MNSRRSPGPATVLAAAYVAGSVPFSNIAARLRTGVDLRTVDDGTVSGTALYGVAGFGPLAIAGIFDVAKGAVGPVLAGRDRLYLAAAAGTAAVVAHNWSPLLKGAGGRGISPALGAMAPYHWPGSVVLLTGLAAGRLARQTGLGSFVAQVALVPVLARTGGRRGLAIGGAVTGAMLLKRLLGNRPPVRQAVDVYVSRLLFDRDPEGVRLDVVADPDTQG